MQESYQHPQNQNILTKLYPDEEKQRLLAEKARYDFENDLNSCTEWLEMHAEWIDMYFQRHVTKQPFDGASEESIPMVLEACSHFHARAMKNLFRSESVVKVKPVGNIDPMSRDRADRLTQHMRYMIFSRIHNYREDKDALLQALPLRGSMFTKVYADPLYGHVKVKNIRPNDLILPYGVGPRDMADIPRKTEKIWVPAHVCQRLTHSGFFSRMPEVWRSGAYHAARSDVDDTIDDATGIIPDPYNEDYCFLLEQHCWLDVTGSGYLAPVIVTVDPINVVPVRLTVGYEVDESGAPLDPYAAPAEVYTHYKYMPNPDGTYGLGHGILLGDINAACNRLLRTIIDSAVLSSLSGMSGFIDKRASGSKTDMQLALGKFIPVHNLENLKNSIWTPEFPGPNAALMNVFQLLLSRGDRLGMVTDLVTGQAEKVMQPTAVMQLLQQTDIVFSSAQERFLLAWQRELQAIYDFNSKFLNEQEYFNVLDVELGTDVPVEILREDYRPDYQVQPIMERASSQQERIAMSDAEFQTLQMFPVLQMDPVIQYNLCARRLEALGTVPVNSILPPLQNWIQAWQLMQQMQQAPLAAEMEKQNDKQEHEAIENEKDRKQETKITKMEIEAEHEDTKIQAEAQKITARAQAEVTKAVGNVKVQNEAAMGAVKVQNEKMIGQTRAQVTKEKAKQKPTAK